MNNPLLPGWELNKRPKKPKKRGRPRKHRVKKKPGVKRVRHKFEETPIGFLLQHEAPLEYALILGAVEGQAPTADFIETIGYSSLNPLFKKPKFRRALKAYREHGLYSGRPKKTTPAIELYYIRIRKNLE